MDLLDEYLTNNEEIPGRQEKGLKEVVARSADLMENLSKISDQAKSTFSPTSEMEKARWANSWWTKRPTIIWTARSEIWIP